jgi:hypothetical protein
MCLSAYSRLPKILALNASNEHATETHLYNTAKRTQSVVASILSVRSHLAGKIIAAIATKLHG